MSHVMHTLPFSKNDSYLKYKVVYNGACYMHEGKPVALSEFTDDLLKRKKIIAYTLIHSIDFGIGSHEDAIKHYTKESKRCTLELDRDYYRAILDLITDNMFITYCNKVGIIQVGDTVETPHGRGIIKGFERFRSDGYSAPMGDLFIGSERILCELLKGHTWTNSGLYGLYTHEFHKLNDGS